MPEVSIATRKRLAVQREVTEIALDLFAREGFEETTVDRIAAAAGMSRRTFFRYFATKEELVLGKWELIAEDLTEAIRARPTSEPDVEVLRRAFDILVGHQLDSEHRPRAQAFDAVVAGSPTLSAAFLVRIDAVEEVVTDVLLERHATIGADDRIVARAMVGAASACLQAVLKESAEQPNRLPELLDKAMAAVFGT